MEVESEQMVKKATLAMLIIAFSGGCATSSLKTYSNPALQVNTINSVAIFPLKNSPLSPTEMKEVNKQTVHEFNKKNPNIKIIAPADVVEIINKTELSSEYDNFLKNLTISGVSNEATLKKIRDAFGVDAILQGEAVDIYKKDGSLVNWAKTSVTIRYILLSTQTGNILWESSSESRNKGFWSWSSAVPVNKVALDANEEVLSALPSLNK